MVWAKWKIFSALVLASCAARGQTTLTGASLVLKSANSSTLSNDSYLGTYLVVPSGGATVSFTVNASRGSSGSGNPHMNVAVADSLFGFTVASTSATLYTTPSVTLPSGTYFIRDERDYSGNAGVSNSVTVGNLSVNTLSGSSSTFSNINTDAIASAAAETYIQNYRKGSATISLSGPSAIPLLPGTPVPVYTGRNAFNFGGTVSGFNNNDSQDMLTTTPPAPGTEQFKFQRFINTHFNTIVSSNAGKWTYNEPGNSQPAGPTMTLVDKQLNYAQSHHMRMRMHNLIWGSGTTSGNQQPNWVDSLISSAAAGNATAKTNLNNAITNRINYYVGTNGNRSAKYTEIDVLNEALHNPSYWNIDQPAGIANIYSQVAGAIAAAGSNARTYLNEYNVLQFSPSSISTTGAESGSDPYANWYRNEVESVRNAGGNVGGIGVQEYAQIITTMPSAATAQQALQNLSVEGIPLSFAEFGMASNTTMSASQSNGPAALETAMRMIYGTPSGTTFMIWDWWNTVGSAYPGAALLDNTAGTGNNTVLTPMGQKWESLLGQWTTNQTVNLSANGSISFNGFYGDYYLSGQSAAFANANNLAPNALPFDMTLSKGTTSYTTTLVKPPNWYFWRINGSGTWNSGSNWTDAPESGGTPGSAGATAYFGSSATAYNLTSGASSITLITAGVTTTLTAPVTLGMMVFDNPAGYRVTGSAITLQGYNNPNGHAAAIYVAAGSHTINSALTLLDNTTMTIAAAGSTLTLTDLQPGTISITKSGAGTLAVNHVRAASLAISAGAVIVAPDGTTAGVSTLASISIADNARLDLNDNTMILNYTGPSPVSTIRSYLVSGFNAGSWDGAGISSSIAHTDSQASRSVPSSLSALGYIDDGTSITVRFTRYGDANLDGVVDATDFQMFLDGLATADAGSWSQGDFTYDGKVDLGNDSNLFLRGFFISQGGLQGDLAPIIQSDTLLSTSQKSQLLSLVPEPSGVAVLAVGACSLIRRRRFA
jgi:GH35 family endo-1,4-beta-xylanase